MDHVVYKKHTSFLNGWLIAFLYLETLNRLIFSVLFQIMLATKGIRIKGFGPEICGTVLQRKAEWI